MTQQSSNKRLNFERIKTFYKLFEKHGLIICKNIEIRRIITEI